MAKLTKQTTTDGKADESSEAAGTSAEVSRLFRKIDWLTFAVTTLLVFLGYFFTLAPNLTLEDSGELAVAADYAGVPHPPGYPVWTLFAWAFTELIPFSNIAWRVGLFSAVAGAFASGLIALMTSRGSSMILEGIKELGGINRRWESALCMVSGFVAGMMLGFNGFMWSQAVIVEVYTLSALSFALVLVCLFRWIFDTRQRRYLYVAFFLFGISFTNHQTLILSAMGIEVLILLADRRLGRDLFFGNCVLFLLVLFGRAGGSQPFGGNAGVFAIFLLVGLASIAVCVWACYQTGGLLSEWRPLLLLGVLWGLGASFYFYMPLASMTNPPMNWAYPRTWDGFKHAFTRGQYEPTDPTGSLFRFAEQVAMYLEGAVKEFNLAFLLLALVPFFFLGRMQRREQAWIIGLTAVYLCLSLLLLILLNPDSSRQSQELTKVFFTPSHMIIAMAIGYGLALVAGTIATHYERYRIALLIGSAIVCGIALFGVASTWEQTEQPLLRLASLLALLLAALFVVAILIFRETARIQSILPAIFAIFTLIPVFSITAHWSDNEQRAHLFGYWFGHDMFEPPYDIYPDMAENAILFGGTDPGRFCPTYMIFSDSFLPPEKKRDSDFDRSDVYIITQNALADGTYLQYIRAHYNRSAQHDPPFFQNMVRGVMGLNQNTTNLFVRAARPLDRFFTDLGKRIETQRRERGVYPEEEIYTPTARDANEAFDEYTKEALRRQRQGNLKAGERVSFQNGQAQVTGQTAVMAINALLAKDIFENNPEHEFYLEESFPLKWMYPHLSPYGIIMKINRKELPTLTQEMIKKNHRFWRRYSERLVGDWITYGTPLEKISNFAIEVYQRRNYPTDFKGSRKFVRDEQAQKAFSKLRSAQAGLYMWRMKQTDDPDERQRMLKEADFAFRQAFAFAPYSPEVVFRYSELLASIQQYNDALLVARTGLVFDPNNDQIAKLVKQLEGLRRGSASIQQSDIALTRMQQEYATNPFNATNSMTLVQAYLQRGRTNKAKAILDRLAKAPQANATLMLNVATMYHQIRAFPELEGVLQRVLKQMPQNAEGWYDLAWVRATLGKEKAALNALKTVAKLNRQRLAKDPEAQDLLEMARQDPRFSELKKRQAFKELMASN